MSNILFKVLVARFYKQNTGFFLLFFVLLFGLLDGKSTIQLHDAIMQGVTSSVGFCGVAMVVWAAYNFKCTSFCLKELDQPENSFLYRMQAVNNRKQFILLLTAHAAIYAPLLAYAAATVVHGWYEHQYILPCIFLLYQLLMCGISAAIYFNKINSTWEQPFITLPSFDISRKKQFLFYLIHYSLSSRKGAFIGIKLCSMLLLQAMVAANTHKLSKEAICVLIMFLISAHSLLPLHYVRFVEGGMAFLRNLPITVMRRLLMYITTYAIIFLPELLFLLLNTHHIMPLELTISLYAVAVAQLSLYTALQYINGINTERYTLFVFGLFFINLLLLASFNLWFLFVAEAAVSVSLFTALYNRYEIRKTG